MPPIRKKALKFRGLSALPFGAALLGALLLLASCWSHSRWRHTEELVGQLKCGMSREEVAALVGEFRSLKLHEVEYKNPWDLVAVKRNTMISFDFEAAGLRRVEVSWNDAILHTSVLPVYDLCAPSPPGRAQGAEKSGASP